MSVRSGNSVEFTENTAEMDVDNTQIPGNNTESQVNDLSARMASSFGEQRQPATSAQESPSRVPTNERWDSNAPEVNLKRTVESILSAIFQRVDSRTVFSSTADVQHVDWHCPGKLMCQGVEVECSTDATLLDIVPNAPFGALKFSSPYDLARLLSVVTQSHIPEAWRTARLLDRSYDLITPTGLGMALSFYQKHCIHATLASVALAGNVAPEHPPRHGWDPSNMAVVADVARQYASMHPWTNTSWKALAPRENLIILPAGFDKVVDCFKGEHQKAVVMKQPEDMQPDWFANDYSSILLFSPAEFAGTLRWRSPWTLLMQMVAKGTELIALAGPQNDQQWKKSVDMLRDLFEETLVQRPSLAGRLRCLLPMRSHQEVVGAGFTAATYEDGKLFTQSAAKRFWTATMAQHASFIKMEPFKRTEEKRIAGTTAHTRSDHCQKSAPWRVHQRRGAHYHRGNHGTENHRQSKPRKDQRPAYEPSHEARKTPRHQQERQALQRIGNKMYKLVPINVSRHDAHSSAYRGRGGRGSKPRQF